MRAKNVSIVLGGAVCAALVLALLVTSDPGSRGESSSPTVRVDAAPAREGGVRPGPSAPEGRPASNARRDGRVELPTVDPSTDRSADGDLVDVEIVGAETREPIPDASVWWWPRSPALGTDDDFEGWLRQSVVEDRLEAAVGLRSDARGRVRVAASERGFFVAAASGDLWGYGAFAAERDGPATVALAPDRDVRVQVLDAKGAPVAGALVALRQRRGAFTSDPLTARTQAPQGIAVLRHAGHFLRSRSDPTEPYLVALKGLFEPPLERKLDLGRPAEEAVRLVLPSTGECEVGVVDEGGQPVGGPFEARLRFADARETGAASPSEPRGERLRSRSGEPVVFEQVEVGHSLALVVTREGSGTVGEVLGPGPRSAGERVGMLVRVGAEVTILRGRVLDSGGRPLADAPVRARLETEEPGRASEASWSLRSSADGRFSFEVTAVPEGPTRAALALFQLSEEGVELASARRALPAELRAGSHDLGDVTLAETPVVAAGVVVDVEGKPVPRATVTPSIPIPRTEDGSGGRWPECGLAPARSDARGRFEIRGEPGTGRISLLAEKQDLVGDPAVVEVGARDVRLVLGASGKIEGTVLLDPSFLGSMVVAHALRGTSASEQGAARTGEPAAIDRNGRFSLRGLAAGEYSLRVVYAANATELGRVEDVSVREGETKRDPRIDPLDLREPHRLVALELVDEGGQPVARGRSYSRPSDEPGAKWLFSIEEGGRLRLLSQGRPLDVAVSAPGFLRTEVDRVTASQRVTLRRAAKLRLELADGLQVPEPPLALGVGIAPLAPGRFAGFVESTVVYFDARGIAACETAFAGDLRVEAFLTRRDRSAPPMVYIEEGAPRVISVGEHAGEQVFRVGLDPGRLEAALRSVREEQ